MVRVRQSDLFTVLFTVLLVGSVGAISATIDSAVPMGSVSEAEQPDVFKPGEDAGVDDAAAGGSDTTGSVSNPIDLQFCVGALRTLPAVAGIAAVVLSLLVVVKRLYDGSTAALVSSGVVPVVLLVYFVLTNCPTQGSGAGTLLSGSEALSGASGLGTAPSLPPMVLAVAAGAVVLLAGGALFVTAGSEQSFEPTDPDDQVEFDGDREALARSAGRAADRIEQADVPVDNAVYRAWREMTALLDIDNPESAPPAEFADEAVGLGLDEENVAELTELFRDVRYGGKDAATREERAVETLREIERTYRESVAGSDPDGAETGRGDR